MRECPQNLFICTVYCDERKRKSVAPNCLSLGIGETLDTEEDGGEAGVGDGGVGGGVANVLPLAGAEAQRLRFGEGFPRLMCGGKISTPPFAGGSSFPNLKGTEERIGVSEA